MSPGAWVLLFTLLAAVALAVMFLDSWGVEPQYGTGMVRRKRLQLAGNDVHMMHAGEATVPIFMSGDPAYLLEIEDGRGKRDVIDVSKLEFDRVSVGQSITIRFAVGRFTNWLYVRDITTYQEI